MTFDRNLWHIRIRVNMCKVIAQIDVEDLPLQCTYVRTYVCMSFSEALGVSVSSYVHMCSEVSLELCALSRKVCLA